MSGGRAFTRTAAWVLAVVAVLAAGATVAVAVDQPGSFTEQALVSDGDATGSLTAGFGDDVALSGDGNTALAFSSSHVPLTDPLATDGAWIFTRSGSSWDEQAHLVPVIPDDPSFSEMTPSGQVALSANGNTAVLGVWVQRTTNVRVGDQADYPADYLLVYTRSGSVWALQQAIPQSGENWNFVLSPDGDEILAEGLSDTASDPVTTAFIYSRSGVTWTATQLPATGLPRCPDTGMPCGALALSPDGSSASVVGWNLAETLPQSIGTGVIDTFLNNGTSWSENQQQTLPAPTGQVLQGPLTYPSEVLSPDGDTLALSVLTDGNVGAVWMYSRSGSAWSQQQKIVPSDLTGGSGDPECFGDSVSFSGDSNTMLIGDPCDGNPLEAWCGHGVCDPGLAGAAWIYGRSDSGWSEEQKIVPTDAPAGPVDFGKSVSLSSDGSTALIGAPGGDGHAWIYMNTNTNLARTTTTTSTTPTTPTTTSVPSTKPRKSPKTRTVTALIDGEKITLTLPSGVVVTALKGSFKTTGSKSLKFVSAALYLDRGVKHNRRAAPRSSRRTRTVYASNATLRHTSARFSLRLNGLRRGAHTLNVIVTYRKRVGRKTELVSKTLKANFTVG